MPPKSKQCPYNKFIIFNNKLRSDKSPAWLKIVSDACSVYTYYFTTYWYKAPWMSWKALRKIIMWHETNLVEYMHLNEGNWKASLIKADYPWVNCSLRLAASLNLTYIMGKRNKGLIVFEYTRTNFANEHEKQLFRGPYADANDAHAQTDTCRTTLSKWAGEKPAGLTLETIHTAGSGLLIKFWRPRREVIVLFY